MDSNSKKNGKQAAGTTTKASVVPKKGPSVLEMSGKAIGKYAVGAGKSLVKAVDDHKKKSKVGPM
ncbi:hypothetical protein C2S53_009992 [Perilla frutescens var. hirtella]|uniref:Uncharacterized protein n=1 Tax=Perilla frutescens var. hirtella TaxID=608512 RepID=A0AAD4NXI6_PERFH|nr:hypothetical protein C2S53_009992 [Perilla frutescens var. hirtella]